MPKLVQFKVTKCDLKQTNQIQQKILVSRGLRVMLDSDLGKALRSDNKAVKPATQTQRQPISKGFCISAHVGGSEERCGFKVVKCDLKERASHQASAARFHRARRDHARQRSEQQDRGSSQHLRRSCICTNARCASGIRRSVTQNRRACRHIRSSFPASLHRNSRPYGTS